jgi:hypothetical protein
MRKSTIKDLIIILGPVRHRSIQFLPQGLVDIDCLLSSSRTSLWLLLEGREKGFHDEVDNVAEASNAELWAFVVHHLGKRLESFVVSVVVGGVIGDG